jgi:hypothetical protein
MSHIVISVAERKPAGLVTTAGRMRSLDIPGSGLDGAPCLFSSCVFSNRVRWTLRAPHSSCHLQRCCADHDLLDWDFASVQGTHTAGARSGVLAFVIQSPNFWYPISVGIGTVALTLCFWGRRYFKRSFIAGTVGRPGSKPSLEIAVQRDSGACRRLRASHGQTGSDSVAL